MRTPAADAMPSVLRSAWTAHRKRYPGLALPAEMPARAVSYLATKKPDMRALQRCFDDAIGRAAQRPGRIRMIPADFGAPAAMAIARRDLI